MSAQPAPGAATLSVWSATALVVGHTIGVGIFLTPAGLIGALASPALTVSLWLVCGVIMLAGALTFGELASRYPQAGGPYIYLREGWGPRVAFLYGWQALLVMDPGITAALASGSAQYLVVLWPSAAGHERLIAVALIWLLAALNMTGLKLSSRVFDAVTVFKLLAFGGVIALAFTAGAGHWSHFSSSSSANAPPLAEGLAVGLVSVFFSFGGFWEASRVAGEVRDGRTLPAALGFGVAAITAVYVATTCAFVYLVPPQETTSATAFARRAGEAMLGASGPTALAAVVLLSVVASAMALLMMAPRVYLAMSTDGLFPAALASVHPATKAPVRATGLLALLASALALLGTFDQIVAFLICATLVFIALAAAALFVVRRRTPGAPAFRVPGYPWTPIAFLVLVACVLALLVVGRPLQALGSLAIVALGWPAYDLFVSARDRRLARTV